MPLRHARDLDMTDACMRAFHVTPKFDREVTLHNLAVVTIELHLEVWRADLFADRLRFVLAVEEKPGMSRVLIGSITIVMPAARAAFAASSRLFRYTALMFFALTVPA